jgi:pyrimidine operon attenuation protein/uracil phosphoribosyltransferase
MSAELNPVLHDEQVHQKIRRMAYEIYENNVAEKTVVLAGIDGQGYVLAQLLQKQLAAISPIEILIAKISIDKAAPEKSDVQLDIKIEQLKKKSVVLVDDVLNTGRTLAYSLKPFLSGAVKKIEVAVLVNRSHALFPVQPSYTGYELSTTLTEHVEVVLGKKSAVYLH